MQRDVHMHKGRVDALDIFPGIDQKMFHHARHSRLVLIKSCLSRGIRCPKGIWLSGFTVIIEEVIIGALATNCTDLHRTSNTDQVICVRSAMHFA